MKIIAAASAFSVSIALALAAPGSEAMAQGAKGRTCVNKAGQGTGSTDDNARFQAWEAVLQATNWSSWASWMSGNNRIGEAPGYSVRNLRQRCRAGGGLGRECTIQATLCQ